MVVVFLSLQESVVLLVLLPVHVSHFRTTTIRHPVILLGFIDVNIRRILVRVSVIHMDVIVTTLCMASMDVVEIGLSKHTPRD